MSGSPLSQLINLPTELLAALGKAHEVGKQIREEVKTLKKEIKEAEKAGQAVSEGKRDRLASLQAKQDEIKERAKTEREKKRSASSGITQKIMAARSVTGRPGSILRSGLTTMDVGLLGSGLKGLGSRLLMSNNTMIARAGGALVKGGAGLAGAAANVAGIAAIGGAAVYAGSEFMRDEYARQRTAAEGTGQVRGQMLDKFYSSSQGGGQFSAADMIRQHEAVTAAGRSGGNREIEKSITERVRRMFGLTKSGVASAAETKSQLLAMELDKAVGEFGSGFEREIDIGTILTKNGEQIMARAVHSRERDALANDINDVLGGDTTTAYLQEEVEKFREGIMKTVRAERAARTRSWNESALHARDRVEAHLRKNHIQAVADERWARSNMWSPF